MNIIAKVGRTNLMRDPRDPKSKSFLITQVDWLIGREPCPACKQRLNRPTKLYTVRKDNDLFQVFECLHCSQDVWVDEFKASRKERR